MMALWKRNNANYQPSKHKDSVLPTLSERLAHEKKKLESSPDGGAGSETKAKHEALEKHYGIVKQREEFHEKRKELIAKADKEIQDVPLKDDGTVDHEARKKVEDKFKEDVKALENELVEQNKERWVPI